MKRLGMVLLGLMFWSMNTLAQEDCGTPPRVLAPGKHSVLLFDQPFVVQWQDDDQCLGDTVKIEITETGPGGFSSQVLASETENKGHYEVWGDQLDEVRRADASRKNAQYIVITNAYDDSISIESKVFLIKPNGLENTLSEQEMYYDKMEDMAIRDLLIRLTAMERQTGYVEDDNEAWEDSGDADLKGGPGRRARKKTSWKSECARYAVALVEANEWVIEQVYDGVYDGEYVVHVMQRRGTRVWLMDRRGIVGKSIARERRVIANEVLISEYKDRCT